MSETTNDTQPKRWQTAEEFSARHATVIALRKSGWTLQKIADIQCVSRQAIHSICRRAKQFGIMP